MSSYVYQIFNTRNGKRYVGWTKNPKERWRKHRKNALLGQHLFIYRALRKDINAFEFNVIGEFLNEEEAKTAERYWIAFFDSANENFGYNMTSGGEGCVMKGEKNPMFGKRGKNHPASKKRGKGWTQSQREASVENCKKRKLAFSSIVDERKKYIAENFPNGLTRGAVSAICLDWNVSHTQVIRFIKKFLEL